MGAGRDRRRVHVDRGDERVPAASLRPSRRDGPRGVRPGDRPPPPAGDHHRAARAGQRHAVDRRARQRAGRALPRRLGGQSSAAQLRAGRAARVALRRAGPGRRRSAVPAAGQRAVRRGRCGAHLLPGVGAVGRGAAHRPGQRGRRRVRSAAAPRAVAGAQRRPRLRRRHGGGVGGAAMAANREPPRSRAVGRGIGRGCRGAGVDDAARGGRRRPPRLLVPHRQRADVAPPHPPCDVGGGRGPRSRRRAVRVVLRAQHRRLRRHRGIRCAARAVRPPPAGERARDPRRRPRVGRHLPRAAVTVDAGADLAAPAHGDHVGGRRRAGGRGDHRAHRRPHARPASGVGSTDGDSSCASCRCC